MDADNAAADGHLADSRVWLRITLLGKGGSGKTSIITQFVNHVFSERYMPTEHPSLYYTTVALKAGEEDSGSDLKFNTLLEIEDTPCCTKYKEMCNFYDFWWPKPQEAAIQKIPKDDIAKGDQPFRSVLVPFSKLYAPVGLYNDQDLAVARGTVNHKNHFFCQTKDTDKLFPDKVCSEKSTKGRPFGKMDPPQPGHQCHSCERFDKSLKPIGEYRPLVRQRMAFIFVFDATSQKSYIEALRRLKEFQEFHIMKCSKMKPVIYLVGNKDDQKTRPHNDDPHMKDDETATNNFKGIWDHLSGFIREQSEQGQNIQKAFVSAAHFHGIQKLFRDVVTDLKMRDTMWKLDPQNTSDSALSDAAKHCSLQ